MSVQLQTPIPGTDCDRGAHSFKIPFQYPELKWCKNCHEAKHTPTNTWLNRSFANYEDFLAYCKSIMQARETLAVQPVQPKEYKLGDIIEENNAGHKRIYVYCHCDTCKQGFKCEQHLIKKDPISSEECAKCRAKRNERKRRNKNAPELSPIRADGMYPIGTILAAKDVPGDVHRKEYSQSPKILVECPRCKGSRWIFHHQFVKGVAKHCKKCAARAYYAKEQERLAAAKRAK